MIAQQNESINEASNTMFLMSADELIQKRCRDREEYYQDIRTYEREIAQRDAIIAQKQEEIAALKAQLEKAAKYLV